ncbi:MAG TPA: hypothetical protein PKD00_04520, partial [Burkholderiales bacterium]|nr:hypothetical protein [Burkholderiales bacterium]
MINKSNNLGNISHQSYFNEYASNYKHHKPIKKKIVNYGIWLKNRVSNKDNTLLNKLNDIAVRIQKRINKAQLDYNSINRYKEELKTLMKPEIFEENESYINTYILCCIFLSKHCTKNETKWNYFFITYKTDSIKCLSKGNFKNYDDRENQKFDIQLIEKLLVGSTNCLYHFIATSLSKLKFTDREAQKIIAHAIYEGKFGNDKEVLKALAASL